MSPLALLLERVLGRLPIGWLQLRHNPTRLLAAVAGVTFADVLVLMQLGFMGALVGSIELPYKQLDADLILSSVDMNTLSDGSPLPRQRMFQARAVPGVASASPLYHGQVNWRLPDGTVRNLDVFGFDPARNAFLNADIDAHRHELMRADTALLDRQTRNVPAGSFRDVEAGRPISLELQGHTTHIVGAFTIGGGFSADGYLVVSDQTFLRLFPARAPGAPSQILVRVEPGRSVDEVARRIRASLREEDTVVRSVRDTAARDQAFQTTQRPVGLIFGFGVVIGVLVGVIIVYQVLATDVADHIKEYATFKAIGYRHRFFLSVIFEESLLLAVMGFVPGLLISSCLYFLVAGATQLPLAMTAPRALGVLACTIAMCGISGAVATRRLARANPAELF